MDGSGPNVRRLVLVVCFTSVIIFLAFYFDVAKMMVQPSAGQKIGTWTTVDVLNKFQGVPNNSKFQGVPNNLKFQGVPNNLKFQGVPNNLKFQGVPNNSKFQGVPNNSKFQGVPNNSKFKDVLNNSKFPSPNLLPCDWKPEAWNKTTRTLCFMACDTTSHDGIHRNISSSTLVCKQVEDHADRQFISSLSSEDKPCLKYFINQHCYGKGHTIPRVLHYVRFGTYNLTLDAFFGMYSSARFLQPCLILFHGDTIPSGPYWHMLLHLVPNIVHLYMDKPREIFGHKINVIQHSSDVARLRIVLEYGGIYADFDQLFLHSFDDLLDKDTVLGMEHMNYTINNALIVAKPKSEFLRIWLSNYTTFNDAQWAEHSTHLPYRLYRKYPHLVHVVYTFFRPILPYYKPFYSRKEVPHYNWTTHYGTHLFTQFLHGLFYGKIRIDKQDNAVGDAIRYIAHGDQSACLKFQPGLRTDQNKEKLESVNEKQKKKNKR